MAFYTIKVPVCIRYDNILLLFFSDFAENMNHNNETLPSTTSTTGTYFTYHIPGMDINPGPYIFTLVSHFLGIITPDELPLGMIC